LNRFFKKICSFFRLERHPRKQFKRIGHSVELPVNGIIADKSNIEIESHVYIGPEPYIFGKGGLSIGRNVIIGPRVTIHTTNHNFDSNDCLPYDQVSYIRPVTIGKNVWIASNVLICPGVTLEEGCVVGMGAVVTKSFQKGSIIGGNPAEIIRMRDLETYDVLEREGKHYLVLKEAGKIRNTYV